MLATEIPPPSSGGLNPGAAFIRAADTPSPADGHMYAHRAASTSPPAVHLVEV
jgi:hypothetical protein